MPEAVTYMLFSRLMGAPGTAAARIETSGEKELAPKGLTTLTLNL
jgi:hypothetical protein